MNLSFTFSDSPERTKSTPNVEGSLLHQIASDSVARARRSAEAIAAVDLVVEAPNSPNTRAAEVNVYGQTATRAAEVEILVSPFNSPTIRSATQVNFYEKPQTVAGDEISGGVERWQDETAAAARLELDSIPGSRELL